MNIGILTNEYLDDAVDQLVDRVEYYVETYGYDISEFDETFVLTIADELAVEPTEQVVAATLHRLSNL